MKKGAVTATGHGTGRGKKDGARGDHNHTTETCTKCGKVGRVTAQCFQTDDELAAKSETMSKEEVNILAKRKTSHKVNDVEVHYQTHISFFNCDLSWTSFSYTNCHEEIRGKCSVF